jgi:hypothetical protein
LELFLELVKVGGLAFALVCIAVISLVRGDVVVRKSHEAELKGKDDVIREKDTQIQREKDRSAELWEIVLPSITVGRGALDKLERERSTGGRKA